SPAAGFVRPTAAVTRHPHHVSSLGRPTTETRVSTAVRCVEACRAHRGPSMTAAEPRSSRRAQRATVLATVTSVATLTSSAVPAHAENFAQYFAQGLVGAINGPGILAVPIVLGFLLASAVAGFIYFFSQPREYDE
ncbi:unnamed protein product, partial [Laminaria digitata]